MLSTSGNANPSVWIELSWGIVLAGLGLVTVLAVDIDSVKSIIALGALPFIFIVLTLVVCFLKALKSERLGESS